MGRDLDSVIEISSNSELGWGEHNDRSVRSELAQVGKDWYFISPNRERKAKIRGGCHAEVSLKVR